VDRSTFLNGGGDEDKLITLWHGWDRLINKKIQPKFKAHSNLDGIAIIKNIQYDVENIKDNVDIVNITHFLTGEREQVAVRGAQRLNSRYNQNFSEQRRNIVIKKQYRHHNIFPTLGGSKRRGMKFT